MVESLTGVILDKTLLPKAWKLRKDYLEEIVKDKYGITYENAVIKVKSESDPKLALEFAALLQDAKTIKELLVYFKDQRKGKSFWDSIKAVFKAKSDFEESGLPTAPTRVASPGGEPEVSAYNGPKVVDPATCQSNCTGDGNKRQTRALGGLPGRLPLVDKDDDLDAQICTEFRSYGFMGSFVKSYGQFQRSENLRLSLVGR
jgi:hypothetical protein